MFNPVLQARFKAWKQFPTATQLDPSFHAGLIAGTKLEASSLRHGLQAGLRLPAEAGARLLPAPAPLRAGTPRNSTQLPAGWALGFARW